jgi:Holliday junction resolvasome RuvABC endonuclease subunit
MSTLALDLGTHLGWALKRDDGRIEHGNIKLKKKTSEPYGQRFAAFENFLIDMRVDKKVDSIYFEHVRRHNGTDAAHVYGGFMACLAKFCDGREIPYKGLPVGAIKKHATGKGNADKAMMIEAANQRGFKVTDDNEADALAILMFGEVSA